MLVAKTVVVRRISCTLYIDARTHRAHMDTYTRCNQITVLYLTLSCISLPRCDEKELVEKGTKLLPVLAISGRLLVGKRESRPP